MIIDFAFAFIFNPDFLMWEAWPVATPTCSLPADICYTTLLCKRHITMLLNTRYPHNDDTSELDLPASYVVEGLPVPGEVNGARGDMDVHDPVDNLGLQITLVLVDHVLLTRVEQLRAHSLTKMIDERVAISFVTVFGCQKQGQ